MEEKVGELRLVSQASMKGKPMIIVTGSVTVGRDAAKCQFVLDDNAQKLGVSRVHCRFERDNEQRFHVTDLGSSNGTVVDGQRLQPQQRWELKPGSTVKIGFTPPMQFQVRTLARRGAGERQLDGNTMLTLMETRPEREVELADPVDRLRWLVEVGRAAANASDPWDLLDIAAERLLEVFQQASSAIVVLYAPDGSLTTPLVPIPAGGHTERLDQRKSSVCKGRFRKGVRPDEHQLQLSRTVIQRVKDGRKPVLFSLKVDVVPNPDAQRENSVYQERPSSIKQEIKSLMCAPLLAGEHNLGFIQVDTETRAEEFDKNDLHVLTSVALQIALLIRNAELTYKEAIAAATREQLSRYLSRSIAERVIRGEMKSELVGSMQKGTIFYSDIVGFTRMSASMSPENTVKLLNRYFKRMQDIVFARGGCVDKCAGDQIMAFWGILESEPEFTARAVAAGIEMQVALFEFNRDERLKKELPLPAEGLDHGIGLNTGMVCAGNIGSEHKIEFTVIGDSVNRAARIESIAGRGQVFVGEATFEEIQARALCIRVPDFQAKGVAEPMKIYSVRGIVIPQHSQSQSQSQPGAGAATEAGDEQLTLENMTFSLPCQVHAPNVIASGQVTGIAPGSGDGGGAAWLVVQLDRSLELGAAVTLKWNIPEKALPELQAEVLRSDPLPDKLAPVTAAGPSPNTAPVPAAPPPSVMKSIPAPPLSGVCAHGSMAHPGMHILSTLKLPAEIQRWKPGTLLNSDYKNFQAILRV